MKLSKRDKNGVRTPEDIERRHKLGALDELPEYEDKIDKLDENKVDKVAGKSLSTNDFTNTDKRNLDLNTTNRHTHENKELLDTYTHTEEELAETVANTHIHNNKELLDSYTQTNENLEEAVSQRHSHNNKGYLDSITGGTSVFYLDNYVSSDFSILRSTCVSKNKRVCISLVGSIAITARTTTTILNLPSSLIPSTQKDFVVFGTTSSSSVCGWGNISTSGVVSVWFPEAVTTYIRTNFSYDIDY